VLNACACVVCVQICVSIQEVPDHVLLLYAQVCEAQGVDSGIQKAVAARENVFLHKRAALKAAHKRLKKSYKTATEWYKVRTKMLTKALYTILL
jgi:hypothetical protein